MTSLLKQQVNQMSRTADQCQSCINSWPFVCYDDWIIKYLLCVCVWMWPARVTKQHSATISSSQPWWVAVDWTFKNDKSVPLGPVFNWICKTKCKSAAIWGHWASRKSDRLVFTGAVEKAETQRQRRDCKITQLGDTA